MKTKITATVTAGLLCAQAAAFAAEPIPLDEGPPAPAVSAMPYPQGYWQPPANMGWFNLTPMDFEAVVPNAGIRYPEIKARADGKPISFTVVLFGGTLLNDNGAASLPVAVNIKNYADEPVTVRSRPADYRLIMPDPSTFKIGFEAPRLDIYDIDLDSPDAFIVNNLNSLNSPSGGDTIRVTIPPKGLRTVVADFDISQEVKMSVEDPVVKTIGKPAMYLLTFVLYDKLCYTLPVIPLNPKDKNLRKVLDNVDKACKELGRCYPTDSEARRAAAMAPPPPGYKPAPNPSGIVLESELQPAQAAAQAQPAAPHPQQPQPDKGWLEKLRKVDW